MYVWTGRWGLTFSVSRGSTFPWCVSSGSESKPTLGFLSRGYKASKQSAPNSRRTLGRRVLRWKQTEVRGMGSLPLSLQRCRIVSVAGGRITLVTVPCYKCHHAWQRRRHCWSSSSSSSSSSKCDKSLACFLAGQPSGLPAPRVCQWNRHNEKTMITEASKVSHIQLQLWTATNIHVGRERYKQWKPAALLLVHGCHCMDMHWHY